MNSHSVGQKNLFSEEEKWQARSTRANIEHTRNHDLIAHASTCAPNMSRRTGLSTALIKQPNRMRYVEQLWSQNDQAALSKYLGKQRLELLQECKNLKSNIMAFLPTKIVQRWMNPIIEKMMVDLLFETLAAEVVARSKRILIHNMGHRYFYQLEGLAKTCITSYSLPQEKKEKQELEELFMKFTGLTSHQIRCYLKESPETVVNRDFTALLITFVSRGKPFILPSPVVKIKSLDLSGIAFDQNHIKQLVAGLKGSINALQLTELNLSDTGLNYDTIQPVLDWLNRYRDLEVLLLNGNPIGGRAGHSWLAWRPSVIQQLIATSQDSLFLWHLGLERVGLDDQDIQQLQYFIEDYPYLFHLAWESNLSTVVDTQKAQALKDAIMRAQDRAYALGLPYSQPTACWKELLAYLANSGIDVDQPIPFQKKPDQSIEAGPDSSRSLYDLSLVKMWEKLHDFAHQVVELVVPVDRKAFEARLASQSVSTWAPWQRRALDLQKTLKELKTLPTGFSLDTTLFLEEPISEESPSEAITKRADDRLKQHRQLTGVCNPRNQYFFYVYQNDNRTNWQGPYEEPISRELKDFFEQKRSIVKLAECPKITDFFVSQHFSLLSNENAVTQHLEKLIKAWDEWLGEYYFELVAKTPADPKEENQKANDPLITLRLLMGLKELFREMDTYLKGLVKTSTLLEGGDRSLTADQAEWFRTEFVWHLTALQQAAGTALSEVFNIDNPLTSREKILQAGKGALLGLCTALPAMGGILHALHSCLQLAHRLHQLSPLSEVPHAVHGAGEVIEAAAEGLENVVEKVPELRKVAHEIAKVGKIPRKLWEVIMERSWVNTKERLKHLFKSFTGAAECEFHIKQVGYQLAHVLNPILSQLDSVQAGHLGLACAEHMAEGLMLGLFRNHQEKKGYRILPRDDFEEAALRWLFYVPMEKNHYLSLQSLNLRKTVHELLYHSSLIIRIKNGPDRFPFHWEKTRFQAGRDYRLYCSKKEAVYQASSLSFYRLATKTEVMLLKAQFLLDEKKTFEITLGPKNHPGKIVGQLEQLGVDEKTLQALRSRTVQADDLEAITLPPPPLEKQMEEMKEKMQQQEDNIITLKESNDAGLAMVKAQVATQAKVIKKQGKTIEEQGKEIEQLSKAKEEQGETIKYLVEAKEKLEERINELENKQVSANQATSLTQVDHQVGITRREASVSISQNRNALFGNTGNTFSETSSTEARALSNEGKDDHEHPAL